MPEFAIRRKPGNTLRVDNLTENRVEGYWNMDNQEWYSLDWLDAAQELVGRGSNRDPD